MMAQKIIFEIMQKLDSANQKIKIFANEKNSEKSQTVKNGILKTDGDLVVLQDADFKYEPKKINDVVVKMLDEEFDLVYGNSFGKKNKIIYWQNYIGNIFVSFVSNMFTFHRIRIYLPNMEVCYMFIRGGTFSEIVKEIKSQ
jgi:glycosyltransferase involved in cell wall biosynthesis